MSEDHLNDHHGATLADLPRTLDPGPMVEDRIVRTLQRRGSLAGGLRPRAPYAWLRGAAAAVVLVAIGVAVGEYDASRRVARDVAERREQDSRQAAAMVQRAGSEYVLAVARLAELAASGQGSDQAVQGREVAVSAMEAAAVQLHYAAPDDPLTRRILDVIVASRTPEKSSASRQVIWY